MHAIESVRAAEEVRGRFRRATNSGELRYPMGRNVQLEERLNDGRRDGIVTAARAQRRYGAFVISMREAELVLR